ncbi:MAG: DUF1566 domain-containing protein [Deltaproteobacteria bacterium]|nr:DUF1566 domain-containing protein [Deltaproteobacteria bacterium]
MIKKPRNLSDWFAPIVVVLFLIICSAIPASAGEWATSRPPFPCDKTCSAAGRWCDNKDGTVTDTNTGLLWLKDASWNPDGFGVDDAARQAAQVKSGHPTSLTDGSQAGWWRLPTIDELKTLTTGTEAVNASHPYLFTGVWGDIYWSSTTSGCNSSSAWRIYLYDGSTLCYDKTFLFRVWPVRAAK